MKRIAPIFMSIWLASAPLRAGLGTEESLFSEMPVVVTASLRRQVLDKVPGSMTVITDKDIRSQGLQTLTDALSTVPGFTMFQEPFGLMSPVIRGYQWSTASLKVMVDGHSVNEVLHKGLESWMDMPLDDVKQIEVIRGPGSSLYGSDAFCAVVNIITRDQPGGSAVAGGGTLGAWAAGGTLVSARDRDLRYKAAFNKLGEEGARLHYEKDYFTDFMGSGASQSLAPTDARKKLERHEGAATVEYAGLSLTVRNVDSRRQWSEGYVGIQAGGRSWVNTRAKYAEATYKLDFPDGSALSLTGAYDVNTIIYTGQFLKEGFTWFGGFPGFTFPEGAFYTTYERGTRDQAHGLWSKTWGGHELTAGVEYSRIAFPDIHNRVNFDVATLLPLPGGYVTSSGDDPNNSSSAQGTSESQWGVFGQDMFRLQPVSFILGARYDNYSMAGAAFSPRLAVIWELGEQILKGSFGQAFFSPYSNTRYDRSFGFVSNKDLRPAVIQTSELSIQNSYVRRFRYALTGFYSGIEDAFSFSTSRVPAYDNSFNTHITGVEAEANMDASPSLSLFANASYSHISRNSLSDLDHPERIANAGFTWRPVSTLSLNARGNFVSSYDRWLGRPGKIPGYGLLHMTAVWALNEGLDLSLIGNNLLDKTVYSYNYQGRLMGSATDDSGYGNDFPWKGRQIMLKVSSRW